MSTRRCRACEGVSGCQCSEPPVDDQHVLGNRLVAEAGIAILEQVEQGTI